LKTKRQKTLNPGGPKIRGAYMFFLHICHFNFASFHYGLHAGNKPLRLPATGNGFRNNTGRFFYPLITGTLMH